MNRTPRSRAVLARTLALALALGTPAGLPLRTPAAVAASATTAPGAASVPPDSSPTLAPPTNLPESRARPSATPSAPASPAATATASVPPSPSPAPSATPTLPPTILVRGQILSLTSEYLVFTTGQAVRVQPGLRLPSHTPLGIFVRATLDTATRAISRLTFQPVARLPQEVDAANVPPELLASSIASLPSIAPAGAAPLSRTVTVTFVVHVPDNTPVGDDVYLATDRSNYGSAEVRMQRSDLNRWTVQLSLAEGTTLHYEYTRGFNTTIERDRYAGIVTPRVITATNSLTTDDTVARWADVQ